MLVCCIVFLVWCEFYVFSIHERIAKFSTSVIEGKFVFMSINGGSQSTTGVFYDSSRTLKMQVDLNASIQNNYYFFEVLNPNAKPSPDDNITTPESVAFSGTGPLWSNTFTWTSYWDANVPGQGFKWEFKGKGTTPSFGFIANCTFSR